MMRLGLKPIIFVLNNSGYTIERFLHGPTRSFNDIVNWYELVFPSGFFIHLRGSQEMDQVVRRAERRDGRVRILQGHHQD